MPKTAKTRGSLTRTARFSLDILDWRCYLTRYVSGPLVRKLVPPKARIAEDAGIESWKFGPTMPKTAKNHGTLTRTARFRDIALELQHFPTQHFISQLV